MENELKPASRSRASKPSQVSSTRATNSSPLSIPPSPVLSPHSALSRPVRLTPSVNCASISSPFYPSYLYSAVTLEAASARMAARDRFGAYAEPGLTPLQRAIRTSPLFLSLPKATRTHTHRDTDLFQSWLAKIFTINTGNACDLSHYEPNLALNLEVADLINSKKGNA